MGYCMNMRNVNFFISKKNKGKALKAIKSLAKNVNEMPEKSYSWVSTDEFLNAKRLEPAMLAFRWQTENDENENIYNVCFDGEKLGDDELFFNAIAPYVKKGSYIEMQGEDGEIWRWVFDGKRVKNIPATFAFND